MAASRPESRGKPTLLDRVERIGNALPDTAVLFVILAGLVLVASWIVAQTGFSVVHPKDGSQITAVNLLNAAGIRRIFTEAVRNFTGFAPLGTVLVAMIGIGVAEAAGLVKTSLRAFVMSVPRSWLTAAVVFTGVNANLAADAGIIVLPPIAALLFVAVGRHPLAGIAAAFAGVSAGFSANLLPSTLDVLLIGFTQEAVEASKLLPGYNAQVLGNYYFMIAATPLLTVVGTWVTHRFVEPRLGPWPPPGARPAAGVADAALPGSANAPALPNYTMAPALPSPAIAPAPDPMPSDVDAAPAEAHAAASMRLDPLSPAERRGLGAAAWALLAVVVAMLLLTLPPGAPLRASEGDAIQRLQPFFDSMVMWVLIIFLIPGIAYGVASGSIRSDRDVAGMAGRTMSTMGSYIVLAFAAAQFVSYFAWSNLGAILAISGADLLRTLGLQGGLLLSSFVVFSALIDVFIASASAKWAVMAPVFVPMFALLGFTPEATQAVFRIGDSCTNVITPLMPYMPFVLACAQRYVPRAGTGTLVAMMLPYFFAFLVSWTGLLLLFYALDWPIGPGVGMRLPG